MGCAGEECVPTLGTPLGCFGVLSGGENAGGRTRMERARVRHTSDCANRLYLSGVDPLPSHFVYWDDEKLRETRCQSGLFTLIGRESANKEAHLPETMILEIPLRRLERVREEAVWREGTRTGISGESWSEVVKGLGRVEWRGAGNYAAPASRRFESWAGDAGREGAGREGGEWRGRRGERENLPPLAASLSAPGLGTKGGTLMNSPPLAPDARVSPSHNFAAATLCAVRPHKSVRAPLGLQQGNVSENCDQVGGR